MRMAAGIVAYSYGGGTFTNCKNSADVTVTNAAEGSTIAGVASYIGSEASMKNCSNSGKISISGNIEGDAFIAAGVAANIGKTTSCRNSGAITVSAIGNGQMNESSIAAGVAAEVETAVSCSNTGKVSMKATIEAVDPNKVGGVFGSVVNRQANAITRVQSATAANPTEVLRPADSVHMPIKSTSPTTKALLPLK